MSTVAEDDRRELEARLAQMLEQTVILDVHAMGRLRCKLSSLMAKDAIVTIGSERKQIPIEDIDRVTPA
jgi:hypothetical protein